MFGRGLQVTASARVHDDMRAFLLILVAAAALAGVADAACEPNCSFGNTAGCCFDSLDDKGRCFNAFTLTCIPSATPRCTCLATLFTCLKSVYAPNCICPSSSCQYGINNPVWRLAPNVLQALNTCPNPCVYTATPAPVPGVTPAPGTTPAPVPGVTPASTSGASSLIDLARRSSAAAAMVIVALTLAFVFGK